MHELGHLILALDDQYFEFVGSFHPATGAYTPGCGIGCETRLMNTDPFRLGLMSNQNGLPHLIGFEKLQLGWVIPRIPVDDGFVTLPDIAETGDLLILPRRNSDAKEHFMLETRLQTVNLTPKYDALLGQSGLAAFHIVEPSDHCFNDQLGDCRPLTRPQCVPDSMWTIYADNFSRAGVRLLQSDLTHWGDMNVSLFNSGDDLTDEALGGGLSCPAPSQIGVAGGMSHLVWTDGGPSGYQVLNVDTVAPATEFDLVLP